VRTPDGPRQRALCYLGELNGSAPACWLKTIRVFNEQGESHRLKLFASEVEPHADDTGLARVRLDQVRLGRPRRFGGGQSACDASPCPTPSRENCSTYSGSRCPIGSVLTSKVV